MYIKGKVCLSILGTWSGPSWTSSQNLSTVLLSIQSLLNENPIINEPGWEKYEKSTKSRSYNRVLTHQVLGVTVLKQLDTAEFAKDSPYHRFFTIMKIIFKIADYTITVHESSAIFSIKIIYVYTKLLQDFINLHHTYCPEDLIYTPEEAAFLASTV